MDSSIVLKPKDSFRVKSFRRFSYGRSVELVRVLIGGIIAEVIHSRSILPDECVTVKLYNINHPVESTYDGFMNSQQDLEDLKYRRMKNPECHTIKVLVRGLDTRCDKILRWLDGIGEAMDRKYLAEMHLRIFHGNIDPAKQLEDYSIAFTYVDGGPDIAFNLRTADRDYELLPSAWKVQDDLGVLIKAAVKRFEHEFQLPKNIKVDMRLEYNEQTPTGYSPTGFKPAADSTILPFAESTRVGSLNSGHHELALKMMTRVIKTTVSPPALSPRSGRAFDRIRKSNSLLGELETPSTQISPTHLTSQSVTEIVLQQDMKYELVPGQQVAEPQTVENCIASEKSIPETPRGNQGKTSISGEGETQTQATAIKAIQRMVQLRSKNTYLDETQFLDASASQQFCFSEQVDQEDIRTLGASSTQGTPSVRVTPRNTLFTPEESSPPKVSLLAMPTVVTRAIQARKRGISIQDHPRKRPNLAGQSSPLVLSESTSQLAPRIRPLPSANTSPQVQHGLKFRRSGRLALAGKV